MSAVFVIMCWIESNSRAKESNESLLLLEWFKTCFWFLCVRAQRTFGSFVRCKTDSVRVLYKKIGSDLARATETRKLSHQ